jgi:hypothetical protein
MPTKETEATMEPRGRGDYEYRLTWERPSPACVMAHGDVAWESLAPEEWAGLPWEGDCLIASDGEIHTRRHTLEAWSEDHYQPVRNVRFERRIKPDPDEGWDEVAIRGATGRRSPMPTSEETEATTEQLFTLPEAAEQIGMEYRTLHSWVRDGLITLTRPAEGSGRPAILTEREVAVCGLLARLRAAGCGLSILEAAVRGIGHQSDPDKVDLLLDGDISIVAWLTPRTGKSDAH